MPQNGEAGIRQDAESLATQLEAIRQSSEDEVREAFRRTVRDALERWPDDRARQVLALLQERFAEMPGLAPPPVAAPAAPAAPADRSELEEQLAFLRAQLDSVGLERDRLRKELDRVGAGEAPTAPVTRGPGEDEAAEKLEQIRQALIQLTQDKDIDVETLDLAEPQERLFRLMRELLRFALDYELGLSFLLAEFRIGDTADMDTQMMLGFKQLVRDRFRDCLTQGKGAVKGLKEILDRNSRFVIDLNTAYATSMASGIELMLQQVDPGAILAENKRMIGFNYEQAYKTLARQLRDLSDQSREELWERFFVETFRAKLSRYIEPD